MRTERTVIFVDTHADAAATMFIDLARHLAGKGFEIYFYHPAPNRESRLLETFRTFGAKTCALESLGGRNHFAIARNLESKVRNLLDSKPILVASESVAMRAIARVSSVCGCPAIFYILTLRMETGWRAALREHYDARLFRSCEGILVGCSWATCEHHILRLGLSPERVRYIPNSIDTSLFQPERLHNGNIRSELGLLVDTRLVTTVGRLHPVKEQVLLIRAMARLLNQQKDLALLIVGSPNPPNDRRYGEICRRTAEELGISKRVHFLGQRSDVRDILFQSTVFAFPSWQEGMALALMEAMACRCIVVSAAIHSACELIQDGWNGYLTPIGDEIALEANITRALGLDSYERSAIGQRAHDVIAARYDRTRVMKLFDPLFLAGEN